MNYLVFRIGTWYVWSLKTNEKMGNYKKEMDRLETDVLGLSELRWPNIEGFSTCKNRIIYLVQNEQVLPS